MAAIAIAHDYPRRMEPDELRELVQEHPRRWVAIGVTGSFERRAEWRRVAEQLGELGVELRWEGGVSGWEARLYTEADQLGPQILAPPGGRDDRLLHEVPGEAGDQGPEAGQVEEREGGPAGDLPGLRDQADPDGNGLVPWGAPGYVWPPSGDAQLVDLDQRPGPDESSALALERWEAHTPAPEIAPPTAHAEPTPAVTPPVPSSPLAGGVTASPLPELIRALAGAGLSTRKIAAELRSRWGIEASHMKVARVLRAAS